MPSKVVFRVRRYIELLVLGTEGAFFAPLTWYASRPDRWTPKIRSDPPGRCKRCGPQVHPTERWLIIYPVDVDEITRPISMDAPYIWPTLPQVARWVPEDVSKMLLEPQMGGHRRSHQIHLVDAECMAR